LQEQGAICENCGLPKDICACGELDKEISIIQIDMEKRKFSRPVTMISGIISHEEAKNLARNLKREFACGGTVKGTTIELQGDHRKAVANRLKREGFNVLDY
jgi:translation initiation factor 1